MNAAASTWSPAWVEPAATTEPPAPVYLSLPGPDAGWAYRRQRWALQMAALRRSHTLRPQRALCYASTHLPAPALCEAFDGLFDLRRGPQGTCYPFVYAQGVVTLLQSHLFDELGLRRRHALHARHHARLTAGAHEALRGARQHIECRVRRLVRTGPTEVMVQLHTRVADERDSTLAEVEDGFLFGRLQVAAAMLAEEDDLVRRGVSRARRRQAEIDPLVAGVRMRQLYLAPDAGRRYGLLSGERGLAHEAGLLARLAGHPQPHAQPLYLRNLLARELAEWGLDAGVLQMSFCGRARLGQTLRLVEHASVFELVDERGRLLAFGKAG